MKIKDIAIAAFAIALIASLGWLWFSPSGFKQAPAISVQTIDGRSIEVASLQGRPLIVNFWSTDCPGCIEEMPHLVELYHELNPQGLEILAIAMPHDTLDRVQTMVREKGLPYPISFDASGAATQAFGDVKLTPTTILIDPQGRIVKQTIGKPNMDSLRRRIQGMLQSQAG